MDYVLLLLGLATLILGGEYLVRGAVGLANRLKLSPLVIGVTVISFGTSAPELIVSASAAMSGNSDIAIGNVIGSNLANISLIVGLTAMIFPMIVDRNSKIIDWPMMMISSLLFYIFVQDGVIVFWEGLLLFLFLIVYTIYVIQNSRKKNKKLEREIDEFSGNEISVKKIILYHIIGFVGLYFGAEWLLDGAVSIAKDFGMEERVIGITVVAFGTSLPELVTSCVAAFRKETDIALGNLIGSNIFNILCVLGITSMINPVHASGEIIHSDMIWMLGITAALLPMLIFGKKLGRIKGFLLFGSYIAYISLLLINMQ